MPAEVFCEPDAAAPAPQQIDLASIVRTLVDVLYDTALLQNPGPFAGTVRTVPVGVIAGAGALGAAVTAYQNLLQRAVLVRVRLQPDGSGTPAYLAGAIDDDARATYAQATAQDGGLAPAIEVLVPAGATLYVAAQGFGAGGQSTNLIVQAIPLRGRQAVG
jgi:hypothetical protein